MKHKNAHGLSIDFLENGSVRQIEVDPIRISLKPATPFSRSGANIFLRKRSEPFEFIPLTGPESNGLFRLTREAFVSKGSWKGIDFTCILRLSEKRLSWHWQIELTNRTKDPLELDLIYVQDVGLKRIADGPVNEYYVSQYIERIVLEDNELGAVVCCRQNMRESVGNPGLMVACKNQGASGSVDGMQFYGKTCRVTGIPEGLLAAGLPGNYAGESSVIALQEKPFVLEPGSARQSEFAALYLPDHQEATSLDDLRKLRELFEEPGISESLKEQGQLHKAGRNLFSGPVFLKADDLALEELDRYFGPERRHPEVENGRLLSFFCGQNSHVMLLWKEVLSDRPHGHIMQTMRGFAPDESIMSTTSFAYGVFNSHLTQGNTNFNVLLSICTSQFNLSPETGQRIFVCIDNEYHLLGVPSAFEMGLNYCRWIYKYGDQCFQVRTWTSANDPMVHTDFRVLAGPEVRLLITHDFDRLSSWRIIPGDNPGEFLALPSPGSMIVEKFPDAMFRMVVNSRQVGYRARGEEALYRADDKQPGSLFMLDVDHTAGFCLSFIGEVGSNLLARDMDDSDRQFNHDCAEFQSSWRQLSLNLSIDSENRDIAAIREILPWYGMNALIHFLTPYGLEQFGGAAWGTRDVSQGPVDLLLAMGKYQEARQVLLIIFSNQNKDGGWPQWWMFDSYSQIRSNDSHGDIFYWVIIALSNYIKATSDLTILEEIVPYFRDNTTDPPELTTIAEHIDRLTGMIVDSFIPGTALVPFGGGDWNDSLQPVSRDLAERMISSWTVEMNYQAFKQYQAVYEFAGDELKAVELMGICERIKTDFNKYLVRNGVVAGYGLVNEDRSISVMLHPDDDHTGVRYSLLPMERGILSDIFSKEQAGHHQSLIEQHLKGPDGARLMDRPLKYKGGIQTIFQRAESSTFFGREIGLMYVHEHIRYAESFARTGKADDFVKALRQAIPVAYREVVPCGDIRQANCYYSSSDVVFKSRYEADELYDEIKTRAITLRGGWRVYSSGPGIYVSLIVTRLLGLRVEYGNVIIDPVIPFSMNGLSVSMFFMGHSVTFRYTITKHCHSPKAVVINGTALRFAHEDNKYRPGGAVLPVNTFLAALDREDNLVDIQL